MWSTPRTPAILSSMKFALAAAGVLLAAVLVVACGGESDDDQNPQAGNTPLVVRPEVTVVGSPTAGNAAPATPTTPPILEPTPSPKVYIVQPGDTLTSICRAEVPDMPEEECVARIVEMNNLPN